MTKLPDDAKQLEFAGHFAERFPTLAGKKEPSKRQVEVVARRVDGQQGLAPITMGYAPRDFVIYGMPHKPVTGGTYRRSSGQLVYKIIGDESVGVPYGQDRIIGIFLATAFQMLGRPANNILRFKVPADILRLVHLPRDVDWDSWNPGGTMMAQLRQSLARTMEATYVVTTTAVDGGTGDAGEAKARYALMKRYSLWFSNKQHMNQHTLWPNIIELDSEFADDLRKHPVPINLDMVRELRTKTAALDLALWQAWRSYGCRKETRINVFGPSGLLEQLGSKPKQANFKMRQQLKEWQREVKKAWPECPNELVAGDEFVLRPASKKVPMAVDERLKGRLARWADGEVTKESPFNTTPGADDRTRHADNSAD